MRKSYIFGGFILLLLLIIGGFRLHKSKTYSDSKIVMGTYASIIVYGESEELANSAITAAWEEILRLQDIFNPHAVESEVNLLNDNASRSPVVVSGDLYDVIKNSVWASKVTNGLFDITIDPLMELYGEFKIKDGQSLPDSLDVKKALSFVGSDYLRLEADSKKISFTKDGVSIDLGGVAKGYAVDKAVGVLKTHGILTGLVNIGGNMYGFGSKEWKIGVQHPRDNENIIDVLSLKNEGVATSGDYERFYISNNLRVHHIINPRNGYSSTANIGVTVIAENAFKADMFSTGLFIMNSDESRDIVIKNKLKVVLIEEREGEIHIDKWGWL